jgi:hypothetical protein
MTSEDQKMVIPGRSENGHSMILELGGKAKKKGVMSFSDPKVTLNGIFQRSR